MSKKKICGCGKIINDTVTCTCKKELNRLRSKERDKSNPEEKKFYNSSRWKKLRLMVLQRDGGFCQRCYIKYGIITMERMTAHHIKPRSEYPELAYDECNLICLCLTCNQQLGIKGELDFIPNEIEEYQFNL